MTPEIQQMLALSTSHLSAFDAELVDDDMQQYLATAPFIAFQKDDYGWFVHVPVEPNTREADDTFPASLRDCMTRARAMGCTWIMFDRDAVPLDDLPTYDW